MQTLPSDFLTNIARKYQLSEEQEAAFLERFSNLKGTESDISTALHISDNAFRTRMSGVYRKFSISGKGPGKFRQLHDFLVQEYQKTNPVPVSEVFPKDINALVQQVRELIKPLIQERCGTMRVLDMTHPIGLNDIYTNVNILQKITAHRRLEINELLQNCPSEDFERFGLGKIKEERVPGLEAVNKYPKLMILGKPGAGKTTFLKYLALQCIEGKFQSNRVPIFITLKDFAEDPKNPKLLEFIASLFTNWGITNSQIKTLFKQGRVLLLLDGLDEVREQDTERTIKCINSLSLNLFLSDEFKENRLEYFKKIPSSYLKSSSPEEISNDRLIDWLQKQFPNKCYNNCFITTCRIAAKEYTFEKFTEVEIADFDDQQIINFTVNWFKNKVIKPENFIQRLEDNKRIQELATNPLLLTLLCLTFEESGDFPANRSDLYKEGIDALLKKWDAKRGIQRDQIYKKLSLQRKEDLLSKIALTTFENNDYFFKQKVAEHYIGQYIRNLPNASTEEDALQLDSEIILKSIEAQHGLLVERARGIYSFSHLTFHEYFTAREFIICKQSSDEALKRLVSHMTEKRWREVFLLAVGMSSSADRLLIFMKGHIDSIITADNNMQEFIKLVIQQYLYSNCDNLNKLFWDFETYLDHIVDRAFELDTKNDINHNLTRIITRAIILTIPGSINMQRFGLLSNCLARTLNYDLKPEFQKALQKISLEIPDPFVNSNFEKWWLGKGLDWVEKLRHIMNKYLSLNFNWHLNKQQKDILKHHYDATLLLRACLNSDCYVSFAVRQQIENTLALPLSKLKYENTRHTITRRYIREGKMAMLEDFYY